MRKRVKHQKKKLGSRRSTTPRRSTQRNKVRRKRPRRIKQSVPRPNKRKVSRAESLETVRKTKIRIIGIGGGGGSIVGELAKSVGRKPIILVGLLGLSLSFLVFAFAANLATLFLSRFVQGLFSGATMPSAR